jgi:DNA-directed RNA polymerase subunit M/transcription elongation factor TFIIS
MPVNNTQQLMQDIIFTYDASKQNNGENMHCGKPMVIIVRQIRSADEPPTIIKKCEICYYSVKKS